MVTELAVGGAAFLLLMYIFRAPNNLSGQSKAEDNFKKSSIA